MRFIWKITSILIALVLAGPTVAQTSPKPRQPNTGGTLYIVWPYSLGQSLMPNIVPESLKLRTIVVVNGKKVSRLTAGEYNAVAIKSGEHFIKLDDGNPLNVLDSVFDFKGVKINVRPGQSHCIAMVGGGQYMRKNYDAPVLECLDLIRQLKRY